MAGLVKKEDEIANERWGSEMERQTERERERAG